MLAAGEEALSCVDEALDGEEVEAAAAEYVFVVFLDSAAIDMSLNLSNSSRSAVVVAGDAVSAGLAEDEDAGEDEKPPPNGDPQDGVAKTDLTGVLTGVFFSAGFRSSSL